MLYYGLCEHYRTRDLGLSKGPGDYLLSEICIMNKRFIYRIPATGLFICILISGFTSCSTDKEAKVQMKRDHIILDKLQNAESYYDIHPAFERAFTFLRQDGLSELPTGRYEIDGDRLFCTISKGPGRNRNELKLEAHRKYIDIQYTIDGTDEIGWKPTADCRSIDTAYDNDKDIMFFNDEPDSWTPVPAGSFVILFPEDAHAPFISSGEIHKVIVKVAIE